MKPALVNIASFLSSRGPVDDPHTPPPARPNPGPGAGLDPEALAALRVALEDARGGFSLMTLVAEGPRRDELLRVLRSWSGEGEVPPLVFSDIELGPNDTFIGRLTDVAAPGSGLVFSGLDRYFDQRVPVRRRGHATDERIYALNIGRDVLPSIVGGPFVLVIGGATVVTLRTMLPDFYSWRTFGHDFEAPP